MKKIALLLLICWTVTWGIAQENCPNFSDVNLPACSCDDCGFIEPKWALLNGRSSVCEGQAFQVSGAESTPLEGIEDFHWYFIELENGVFSLLDHIEKTTAEPVTYLYNVDADEVPCDQQSVFLWLDLVITSPDCPEGESCRNKASTIEVKLMPRAEFFPAEVCLTDEVFFANGSCHATSYIWEFGDGNTSTDENPNHQYDQPGVYTVTLTAINDCGQDTATGQILVVGEPVASFTPELDSDSGCTPLSGTFSK